MRTRLIKLWPLSRGRRRIAKFANLNLGNIEENQLVRTKPGDYVFYVHQDDVYFDVFFFNDYEVRETDTILSLLNKGDIFYDVGANFGWFTINSLKKILPEGKVICFEPQTTLCNEIKINLEANNLSHLINEKIFIIQKAVGSGTAKLYLYNDSFSHAQSSVSNVKESKPASFEVDQITLDHFFNLNKSKIKKPRVIKCDVEGWELNVIKGASEICSGSSKPIWLLEINKEAASFNGWETSNLIGLLQKYGYDNFVFLSYAYKPFRITNFDKLPSTGNMLVFHSEDLNLVNKNLKISS